jgi:hypothetical protein
LREHEAPKLIPCKLSLPVEHHPAQVFFQGELTDVVCVEGQVMPVVHLSQIQIEYLRSQMAGLVVLPVGEQDASNVQKQRVDEPA